MNTCEPSHTDVPIVHVHVSVDKSQTEVGYPLLCCSVFVKCHGVLSCAHTDYVPPPSRGLIGYYNLRGGGIRILHSKTV